MSLVGYRAQNHPQQTPLPEVDDRAITNADFAPLHERFRFTVDAAASHDNAKLPRYWTHDDDALAQSWAGERVWCNPPYSDIRPWVEKAHSEWAGAPGTPDLVVMLLPANRTEQGWWQGLIEPHRRSGLLNVEFLRGRMRFDRPGAVIGPKGDRPPFGCCLVIWAHNYDRRARYPGSMWVDELPVARCNRCGRSIWTANSVDTEDRMTQPDGNPCGGRFRAVVRRNRSASVTGEVTR